MNVTEPDADEAVKLKKLKSIYQCLYAHHNIIPNPKSVVPCCAQEANVRQM